MTKPTLVTRYENATGFNAIAWKANQEGVVTVFEHGPKLLITEDNVKALENEHNKPAKPAAAAGPKAAAKASAKGKTEPEDEPE